MSDWVAGLIERAVNDSPSSPEPEAKNDKSLHAREGLSSSRGRPSIGLRASDPSHAPTHARDEESELAQMYTAPPFWARDRQPAAAASERA